MGKKTERIAELEERLAAANSLIRTLGQKLTVNVGDDITPDNVGRYTQRFIAALQVWESRFRNPLPTFEVNEPNDVRPARRPAAEHAWDTFDDEVDQEIDRLEGRGLVPTRSHEAMQPAERAGLTSIMDIAREVGVDTAGLDAAGALSAIYQEILRIKNPGDVAGETGKGDSLVEAIGHGRKMEHDLRDELRNARESLGRIAAAMQLPDWEPKDTGAILARIQRWESIKILVRRRLMGMTAMTPAVRDELRYILAQIIAPADLGKFLGKLPVVASSPSALQAAESPPAATMFTGDALVTIRDALQSQREGFTSSRYPVPTTLQSVERVFDAMAKWAPVAVDFVDFLNLVVVPTLKHAQALE